MSIEQKIEEKVDKIVKTKTASRLEKMMGSSAGEALVAVIAFLEAVFPIPLITDPFLMAAILANQKKVLRIFVISTTMSVIGGVLAFLMATWFFDILVGWMSSDAMEVFQSRVDELNGSSAFLITLVGAVTPVPYTITAWAVAAIEGSLIAFTTASIIGRGFRYAIISYTTYKFGPLAISYARRYIGLASFLVVLVVVLYVWLKM